MRSSIRLAAAGEGRRLRLWHVGGAVEAGHVNGINASASTLITWQVAAGHVLTHVAGAPPDPGSGVGWAALPPRSLRLPRSLGERLRAEPPDLVHFHSVFVPSYIPLAAALRRRGIPYLVKLGGGLIPQDLARGRVKKVVFGPLAQRPMLARAAAVVLVTEEERRDLLDYVPGYAGLARVIPNPVELDGGWQGDVESRGATYLGRYDVEHKGVDRLVTLGRLLPELRIDAYGAADRRGQAQYHALTRALPDNVRFHDPVYGQAKAAALEASTIYLHPARWEAFGISIAEALRLGVPCAVGEGVALARAFRSRDLGLVLPGEPAAAAPLLAAALRDPARLHRWSQRGRAYAREHFDAARVVAAYDALYGEVLRRKATSSSMIASS
jgi:glycosyltransferase involved in cell wall biosynthesis